MIISSKKQNAASWNGLLIPLLDRLNGEFHAFSIDINTKWAQMTSVKIWTDYIYGVSFTFIYNFLKYEVYVKYFSVCLSLSIYTYIDWNKKTGYIVL